MQLLRKMSRRRKRPFVNRCSRLQGVQHMEPLPEETETDNQRGGLPFSSIQLDSATSRQTVSPLPSPSTSALKVADTDATTTSSSTLSSSHQSSDSGSDTSSVDYYEKLYIPPRPAHSRWNEDDFRKVVRVWELSQDEVNKMRELETKLLDVAHWKNNPFEVVRFMKGPQGYKPAERLFRRMIDWRVREHVDTILDDFTPPQVLMEYVPSAILHGLDHEGDPIYLERAGATDAASLLKRFGHDHLIQHIVWLRELCGRGKWIQDHEERMGRPITQVTIVYDLAGLNARHMRPGVLHFFEHMMRLTQDYYTGPVKVCSLVVLSCGIGWKYHFLTNFSFALFRNNNDIYNVDPCSAWSLSVHRPSSVWYGPLSSTFSIPGRLPK